MTKFKKPNRLKMSKRSEIALDKSIEHWYRVRDENEIVLARNCALCLIYLINNIGKGCIRCPVYIKTKVTACDGTPYDDYYEDEPEPERKRLAQNEIDFLQTCYY